MNKSVLGVILGAVLATSAMAVPVPIVGDLSFTGSYTVDHVNLNLATKFTGFSGVVVVDPSGDYAGTDGAAVTFTAPLVFDPVGPVLPLWQFTFAGKTYSLDAVTMNVSFRNSRTLVLEGDAIAKITGFADTPGSWNLTANRAGASFSFSSSAEAIPEPTGFVLTGLGLLVFGVVRRRLSRA